MNGRIPTPSRRVHDTVREQYAERPICAVGDCDRHATVATSEGPMCREHADELAEAMKHE